MAFFVALGTMSACSESPLPPVSPLQPRPPQAAPSVTQVVPSVGAVGGGANITISGTGFEAGTVVTFDGVTVGRRSDVFTANKSTTLYAEAPAHGAGTVDVVVTNADGQSHRLEAGYTYAPGESFDLNGVWWGFTDDTRVQFEIKNDRLVSATCWYTVQMPFIFSEQPTVHNGEFQLYAEGATLTGRVVSHSEIVGTMNFPLCNPAPLTWRVDRKIS